MNKKHRGLVITGSSFIGNGGHGISIPKDADVQFIDSIASGNFKDGIHVRDDYDVFEDLRQIVDDLLLDNKTKTELLSNVAIIENQLSSSNIQKNTIEKSFSSVKTILEMVVASAIYNNSSNVAAVISNFMEAMTRIGLQ